MICIELEFTDDPARLAARPAHRVRLQQLHDDGLLLAAGPWGDDSGALIVLLADLAKANAVIAEDPYFSAPGVTVASVRLWEPVVGP